MDYTNLGWRRSGAVVHLVLTRPDHANGLDAVLTRELAHAATACDTDPTVRAVVLTGTDRFFCAGADLKALAAHDGPTGPYVKGLADDLHRAVSTFARMDAPLVVAVNGPAAGAGHS